MAKQDIDSELYKATETMSAELYRASEKNFDLANETSSKLSGQLFALSTLVITVIFGLVQAEKLSIDWLTVLSLITSLASIICGLNRLAVDTNFLIKEGRNK